MQGISEKVKRTKVFRYLHSLKAEIIFLQETHWTRKSQIIIKNEWGGDILFLHGESNARGVAILFSRKSGCNIIELEVDGNGRVIQCTINIDGKSVRLCNIYAPNMDDSDFYVRLCEQLQDSIEDSVIVGGDLNVILDNEIDKKGGRNIISKSNKVLNSFLEENNWCDIWRSLNPDTFQFTWKGGRPLVMSRLDYFLAPISVCMETNKCQILPATVSDHCPVSLTLSTEYTLRGAGYWKLNNRHLCNKDYVEQVNKSLELAKVRYSNLSPTNKWESVQNDARQVSMSYAWDHACRRNSKIRELQGKLKTLHKKLAMINVTADNAVTLIQKVNDQIDKIKLELK